MRMAFRYPLQSLLRLRESLERQEENRLFAVAAEVARLRAQIEELRQGNAAARRRELNALEVSGGVAITLQFMAICDAAVAGACARLQIQLDAAEHKRLLQLAAYQAARQKREILEGLRERQESAYQVETAHHEQQSLDDSFLLRHRSPADE